MSNDSSKLLSLVIVVSLIGFLLLSGQVFFKSSSPLIKVLPSASPSQAKLPFCTDHNPGFWHPAVKKDAKGEVICRYGHEHGDPVPQWVSEAGFIVGFDHMSGFHANTSGIENIQKHPGMKGFSANIKGVEVYARVHLASNVLDRTARFHSYELFLKDPSGAVSHFQGWLNTGDPVADRIPYQDKSLGELGIDPHRRPILWASTRHACEVDRTWCQELWSMTTSSWGPEIVWGINPTTTFFQPGEKYDPDIDQWQISGNLGTRRSLSLTIYRKEEDLKKRGLKIVPTGKIWATQFGEIVSGVDDPRCGDTSSQYGVDYQNICLENFIAPTLVQITPLDNTIIKEFDAEEVELPN